MDHIIQDNIIVATLETNALMHKNVSLSLLSAKNGDNVMPITLLSLAKIENILNFQIEIYLYIE